MIRDILLHAEHEFNLDRVVDGHSLREHYEEAARYEKSWKRHLDNPVPLPVGTAYLWNWFSELNHTGRDWRDGYPQPLRSTEIAAWCHLNRVELATWELRALRRLDVLWRSTVTKGKT